MIVIVNSQLGNLGSIKNMLKKIGVDSVISSDLDVINKAEKLILPGVGSFDSGMKNLTDSGQLDVLNKKALQDKVPVLGICLGMQLMTKSSEEGVFPGLGWINAETIKFNSNDLKQQNLRLPHIGWNLVETKKNKDYFISIYDETRFYFVHSYHVVCHDKEDIMSTTNYGGEFVSSFQKDNVWGVQFHPEKSHQFGMHFLKKFIEEA